VYVAQLDKHLTKGDLEQLFGLYGTVLDAKILLDISGQSRGAGFVRFGSRNEAQVAINELNNTVPQGSLTPLVVKFADSSDKKRKAHTVFLPGYGKPSRYDPMGGRQRVVVPAVVSPYHPAVKDPTLALYQYPAYQPAVTPQPTQTFCLFVYNLPTNVDDSLLYRLFGPFGAISHVNITREPGGKSKGYGFVHFMKFEDAHQAVTLMNGASVENKMLQVSFKAPKS